MRSFEGTPADALMWQEAAIIEEQEPDVRVAQSSIRPFEHDKMTTRLDSAQCLEIEIDTAFFVQLDCLLELNTVHICNPTFIHNLAQCPGALTDHTLCSRCLTCEN